MKQKKKRNDTYKDYDQLRSWDQISAEWKKVEALEQYGTSVSETGTFALELKLKSPGGDIVFVANLADDYDLLNGDFWGKVHMLIWPQLERYKARLKRETIAMTHRES